jgi:hypothetical protein
MVAQETHHCRTTALSQPGAPSLCRQAAVPHLRPQAIRSASPSLPAAARARPQGQRLIRRAAVPCPSSRRPSRPRRASVVAHGWHRSHPGRPRAVERNPHRRGTDGARAPATGCRLSRRPLARRRNRTRWMASERPPGRALSPAGRHVAATGSGAWGVDRKPSCRSSTSPLGTISCWWGQLRARCPCWRYPASKGRPRRPVENAQGRATPSEKSA